MRIIPPLVLACFVASGAFAQQVVGMSMINGKKVELLSDNTWRYLEFEVGKNCKPIHSKLDFCGNPSKWRPQMTAGTDMNAVFTHDGRNYAGYLAEDIGSLDGVDIPYMQQTALDAAAMASGVDVLQIPVVEVVEATMSDIPAETMVYAAKLGNMGVVYANTIIVLDDFTLQAITWSIGKEFTDKQRELHQDFVESTKIKHKAPVQ